MGGKATPGDRRASTRKWVLLVGSAVVVLLYLGLRFESVIGQFCTVCSSDRTFRQRGFALAESRRLWKGRVSEEVVESEVAREFLGKDHEHDWQTWSNLYIAVNGRSGGHPVVRWHPGARAWRHNPRFRAAVRSFAASGSRSLLLVEAMFRLPAEPDGKGTRGEEAVRTIQQCRDLFEQAGEKLPPGWGTLLSR